MLHIFVVIWSSGRLPIMDVTEAEEGPFVANDAKVSSLQ